MKKIIYHPASKPHLQLFSIESSLIDKKKYENIESLDFNTLELNVQELYHLAWRLMMKCEFFEKFTVSIETWMEFIWRMERKYNKKENPFHNFYHGLTGLLFSYFK